MERTKSQFSRLLALDSEIRDGRYPNCLTFSVDWEVSQKTVQRDVDFLRDQLQAPIKYDRERKGFYYTDPNWFLPSLSLSEGDLLALLVGSKALESYRGTPVAKDLERIFGKLAEMLPDKLSLKPELVFNRFTFTSPPSKPIDEKVWTTLVRGLLNQRCLRIAYVAMEAKEAKDRVIAPYHIANLAGEWYVFAHCHLSDQLIQFAIPRIKNARLLKEPFSIPDDFNMEDLLSKTFGRFAIPYDKVHTVRLLFDKEIAPWVLERQWHPEQSVKKRRNGDIELSFQAAGLFEVFRWVMAWGHYCKVLAPRELKNWVFEEVKLMGK